MKNNLSHNSDLCIGFLGGGQLGRMSILAGRRLGYRFWTMADSPECPASNVSDVLITGPYEETSALDFLAENIDVATLELEDIPLACVRHLLKAGISVMPGLNVLEVCQDRFKEKTFLKDSGFPHVEFKCVNSGAQLEAAVRHFGVPCVLKTVHSGYDGKGQMKIEQSNLDFRGLWEIFDCSPGILEKWIDFAMECSVIVARSQEGQMKVFPVAENIHKNHILHQSIVPARMDTKLQEQAKELAIAIAEKLECVGLLAVEMFVDSSGNLLVNEMAPRPHNSGHWSLEACQTSQFEQHIRTVAGLPLGSTRLLRPAVTVNLMGDVCRKSPIDCSALLESPNAYLHTYNKLEPRVGRKMGHVTILEDDVEGAVAMADKLVKSLDLVS